MHETQSLAEWIASRPAVPAQVEQIVAHALLDTVGCGLFGRRLPWAQKAERWARQGGAGPGPSSVWGDSQPRLRTSEAAFVNGVAAHAFELDDYHPAKIHPGAVIVPAVLAMAEAHDLPGDRLLAAIAVGYETMIRVSLSLEPSAARLKGWHLTGVTGPLGAAAALAVLLELDAAATAWALGLAGTQSSGLFAFTADGAMSKRFHAGDAARAGVVAVELASDGFTGPTQLFEAPDGGLLAAFSPAPDPARLVAALGRRWHSLDTAFKPYSCCGSLHAYVDAAIELRERLALGPDNRPGRVRVGLPKVVEVQCGFDYEIGSVLSAQMNARYCVASALRFGSVLPGEFSEERLHDPITMALVRDIEQVHDPALDDIYPEHFCGWVEVEREPLSNEFERAHRNDPSGSAANPAKGRVMVDKFHRLLDDGPQRRLETLREALLLPGHGSARSLLARIHRDYAPN